MAWKIASASALCSLTCAPGVDLLTPGIHFGTLEHGHDGAVHVSKAKELLSHGSIFPRGDHPGCTERVY